ncbi:MAG: type IIA DNA topoisomerase subunit B [Nitrospinae bacterium]|nr:type IIA DNA topoisomerase subunit B [Nitrospinota bacterium]
MSDQGYSAKHIEVLEGLEPVRVRPGMYIGGTDTNGLHHLVWEALDNAVDEAVNGYCDHIVVTLGEDGTCSVDDNGRGIPVDKHPKYNKPALEVILTTLHSGAKFSNKTYNTSGGLHGVGVSVVNALSEKTVIDVRRDGGHFMMEFSRGLTVGKLKRLGDVAKGVHGTTVTFLPDSQIFPRTTFTLKSILERAETKAFLNARLTIDVIDRRTQEKHTFHYPNGVKDYLAKLLKGRKPVGGGAFHFADKNGMAVEVALQWTEQTETSVFSYANSVYTSEGGAHENGLRAALAKTLRTHMGRSAKYKNLAATAEDVKEGLVAVLSVYLSNPQFQGQTKEKLNNPEAATWVDNAVRTAFERFLLEQPTTGEEIMARVALAAQARMASRSAKDSVMRKTAISHRLTLPGKLADCSSTDPSETELFIVEGDSAGGSSKQARDRRTQAVLPLRGKILNVENATAEKLAANNEVKSLTISIGTGMGKEFDYSKLRYDRIVIMTDADVDGAHISALLLTFFFRFMPKLVEKGHIYLAQPPLFKIELGKDVRYALDDAERDRILADAPGNVKPQISRFKGLGEMPMNILKETTMDRSRRRLLQVTVENALAADAAFSRLMGKDASARYEFLEQNSAAFVSSGGELDI